MPSSAFPCRLGPAIGILVFAAAYVARGETDYRVLDSKQAGPTVVIHATGAGAGGNALRQLQQCPPQRGLVILARSRPATGRDTPRGVEGWEISAGFAAVTQRFPGSRILTFEEDIESHAFDPLFRGDTVQGDGEEARAVLTALRELESSIPGKAWQMLPARPEGSEIVVTTNARPHMEAGLRPAVQEREFRNAALALLANLQMTGDEAARTSVLFPAPRGEKLRVAVYDDTGARNGTGRGPAWLRERLARNADLIVELVGVPEILGGALQRADVLVMGGGKANLESASLGKAGRAEVIRFVEHGGGYLGICAGAYLGSSSRREPPYLHLLPVEVGATDLTCETPLSWNDGPLAAGRLERADLHGGPTFRVADAGAGRVQVWATFTRDEKHPKKGTYPLKETPAVIAGTFGKGRVVLTSTHCERPPSPSTRFADMVRWAGRAE
ncbi:BPL-N domain-containing protein [Luteolibacter marinus]|uniref:BPL-N domain-containing protein n=1 Tax=Luteolibacter marinus TaxID=2776705 RepID=UPI0018681036|nr:BPL-N domain-containing protein [Luteolibacter marinus]